MAKSDLHLPGGGEYALVAYLITLFYARHPEGRIITELVSRTETEVTFRALVYAFVIWDVLFNFDDVIPRRPAQGPGCRVSTELRWWVIGTPTAAIANSVRSRIHLLPEQSDA